MSTKELQPHQQRVVQEKADLDEKIATLGRFLNGEIIKRLEHEERTLLAAQFDAMTVYSNILGHRIALFK